MKVSSFYKFIGAGAIAASLAVLPLNLPAQAQNAAPNATQPNGNADRTGPLDKHTNRGDTNDIGWFGLIGLAGLAGLAAKRRKETTH
ncbi:MAG TPA: WGxxGxxG family protein [Chroococcales cyanobacterium]